MNFLLTQLISFEKKFSTNQSVVKEKFSAKICGEIGGEYSEDFRCLALNLFLPCAPLKPQTLQKFTAFTATLIIFSDF